MDFIEEAVPTVHILKSYCRDIIKLFKDFYFNYWANTQGDLTIVPVTDAVKITHTILSYVQNVATMAKAAQEALDKNSWSLDNT